MTDTDRLDTAIAELQSVTDISAMEGFGDLWNGHDFCHEQAAHDPAPIDDAIAEILNAVLSGRLARAALAAAPQPAPAPAADERDEIERIICDAFTCDIWGRGDEDDAFWQTAADALLAAGYRKADACADAPETLAWAVVVDGDVVWVDAGMGRKRDVADIVAEEEGGKPVRVAIRVVEDEA